ncbi:putative RecF/RecN/SMC N domain [Clostridium botulinum C str. Eklund]|nr:putative RecF/RecN/SMC N domain [Clostridium botulinum C str. Eklund]NEZ48581.1 DUF2813 domain-containing protein [Clostridium botulinum]
MGKNIFLKKLALRNFKGIKDLNIDFSKVTNIYGENATGKTTIVDAFTWLLFDKDSQDRVAGDKESNFQIKTLDKNGQVLHGLEHEVIGVLSIDGKDITLSKIYKEKWTKRRGEAEKTLTGHETLYSIDEVPVKKKEYQEAINKMIDEDLFKLITNPLYFSTNMKWQDRRNTLLEVIDSVTDEKVANSKTHLKPLLNILEDKDIDTLTKSIKARKKRLNDEIKAIPIRIDEANNSIKEVDVDALEFRKRGIVSGIKSLEEQLLDSSKVNDEVLKEKDKLYSLKSKLRDMEYQSSVESDKPKRELEKKLNVLNIEINRLEYGLKSIKTDKQNTEGEIEKYTRLCDEERKKWFDENDKPFEFDENNRICPTCKRPFSEEEIKTKRDELENNFNANKAENLKEIRKKGTSYKTLLEKYQEKLKLINSNIEASSKNLEKLKVEAQDLKEEIDNFKSTDTLENNKDYQDLKTHISELENKLQQPKEVNNQVQELKERKSKLELELEEVNSQLTYKEQNEKLKDRIQELQDKEKKLAQQIAELEGQEYLCEEFIKTKVELLESSINDKFKYVSFKLFDTQVNGGLNETCEALIDGVPFSNANTASQINAGLDIINALSGHYQVAAPIFIDNRESVNQLIETYSQVINLIVSKDKNLKVGNRKDTEENDDISDPIKFILNEEQFSKLRCEEELKFKDESGISFDLEFQEQTEWIDEGKYQYCSYIYRDKISNKYFLTGISRSGSYFSDYYYSWEDEDTFEFIEVSKKKIVKEIWG